MQCTALAALLVAMLDNPPAARALERADGLPVLASLLRDGGAERPVVQAARACLGAYLVPEEPDRDRRAAVAGSGSAGTMRRRAASPPPAVGGEGGGGGAAAAAAPASEVRARRVVRSVREKERLVARHFGDVAGIVREFKARQMLGAGG